MRARRTGEGAGSPRGSDVHVAGGPRRPVDRPRQARRQRRTVLLLVGSLALLVPIGLQIHLNMADQAVADQAVANRAVADRAVANRAVADKATADQAAAVIKKAKTTQPVPETVGLEPSLAQAFNRARTAALAAGLELYINSGFRSAAAQQRLYDDVIAKYGSAAKARRWVLPPAESDHVKGLAIDVGPPAAAAWLEKRGVSFGLCRRYLNEWWHFERLAPAIGQRCPALEPYAGG